MIHEATEDDALFIRYLTDVDPGFVMGRCHTLVTDYGAIFLEPWTPSIFEAHINFHPDGRGRHAIEACKEAMKYAWDKGAYIIIGRIPIEDRAARLMTRWIGFKSVGIKTEDGRKVEWFEMRKDQCQ